MEAIMTYVGVSTVCLSICYVGFLAFQHQEMKLRHLRGYLLATMLLALLLPLSNARIQLPALQKEKEVAIQQVVSEAGLPGHYQPMPIDAVPDTEKVSWTVVLAWLYVTVASFFLIRILIHLSVLFMLSFRSVKKKQDDVLLIINRKIKSPFSFFKWIYLSEPYLEKKDILAHEKIHASQYHSLDILLIELLSAVMWFNPFVWMMRKSVQLVHEYLADEGVLSTGIDRLQYQTLLVNQVAEGNFICLSSGFHHSLIKKRLIMMTKNKPDHDPKLRILTIIPIAIFLFLGIACLNGQNASNQKPTPKEVVKPASSKAVVKTVKKPEKVKFWGWITEKAYADLILKERFFVVSNNKHLTKEQYLSIQTSQIDSIQLQGGVQTEQEKERVRNYLIDNGLYEEFKAGKYAALMVVVLKKGL